MEYDFDDIDDYLNGRMSEADRAAFETALKQDPELADEVEAQRAAEGVLFAMRVEALKQKMAQWDEDRSAETPPSGPSRRPGLVVAFLLLLAVAGWGVWKFSGNTPKADMPETKPVGEDTIRRTPPPENFENPTEKPGNPTEKPTKKPVAAAKWPDLYQNIEPGSGIMGEGNVEDTTNLLSKAKVLYKNKKYKDALILLSAPDSSDLDKFVFLRAHTHYQLKQYALAEQDFRAVQKYARLRADAELRELACLIKQMPDSRARLKQRLEEGLWERLSLEERREIKKALK